MVDKDEESNSSKSKLYYNLELDKAIELTGVGWFHRWLFFVCGIAMLAVTIELLFVGYILPSAQCDLKLTTGDKGILGAAGAVGMILGSYFMGLLADVKGRKVVLATTLILDGLCDFAFSFANDVYLYIFGRFLNGIFICAPGAIVYPYLGEFYSESTRSSSIIWMCVFIALGISMTPALAWLILSLDWTIYLPTFNYNSWRIYMVLCGLPTLISGLCIGFTLPESPKYLLNRDRQKDALGVLQNMFARNTGSSPEEYPVKSLTQVEQNNTSKGLSIAKVFSQQTIPLFKPPYLLHTLLVCFLQFGILISSSGVLVWLPELFNRQSEYLKSGLSQDVNFCYVTEIMGHINNNLTTKQSSSQTLLEVMDAETTNKCESYINTTMFSNYIILGGIQGLGFLILGILFKYMPKKYIIMTLLCTAGSCGIILHAVGLNQIVIFILSCAFCVLASLSQSVTAICVVDIFPTTYRAMAVCISLMSGRFGAVFGSLIIGQLVDDNCQLVFCLYGSIIILCGLLSWFLP